MSQLHLPGSGGQGCQSPFLPGPAAASHHKWVWPAKKQQRNTQAQWKAAQHGSASWGINAQEPQETAAAPARRQLRELSLPHAGKLSLPSAGNVVSDGNPWCDTHCVPMGLRRVLRRRQNPSHKLQTQLLLHGTVPGAPTSWVLPSGRAHPHQRLFPSASAACLYSKAKTHSKGELDVFRSLIKRGKTTQCWQFSSSQPLPVPCTSNSRFPAGAAPASPLPPPAPSSSPWPSTQEGQSQEEGKQLIQPAGKRKGKNTRKEPCSTAVCQWKKNIQALFTGGLDAEVARVKLTHATASGGMGMGTGHVLPRKVLRAPLLLPVKL